jgi:hypothetical protein
MDYLQKIQALEGETPKTHKDWLAAWRELAQITYGITAEDSRFERVMMWMNVADEAFKIDSWGTFQEAAAEVKRIAKEKV